MKFSATLIALVCANVALAAGTFITDVCKADADCNSGCCAFNTGKCAGNIIALSRDGGCGFGDAKPNDNAAKAAGFTGGITSAPKAGGAAAAEPAAANNAAAPAAAAPAAAAPAAAAPAAAAGAGAQFITGDCTSDGACASGCCNAKTGKCAARAVAEENNKAAGGCGFGGAAAPAAAAPAAGGAAAGGAAAAPAAGGAAAAGTATKGGPAFDQSGAKNVGNGAGAQFIGAQCLTAADCGSGCCAGPSGICSGLGAQTQNGKTGCGFVGKRMLSLRASF